MNFCFCKIDKIFIFCYYCKIIWALCCSFTKIFLFLPSICTKELLSTPKIMSFFPCFHQSNSEREVNPLMLPLYLYLSRWTFLDSFIAPNRQLSSVKSLFKSFDHVSNSNKICTVLFWTDFFKFRSTKSTILINLL